MLTKFFSDLLIKSGKAPVFDNPADYGLEYEDVTFTTDDGVELSGWLIKGGTDKVIIQTHFGIQSSRSGFTLKGKNPMTRLLWNDDIHFLKQAKYLQEAGYSVLMYDMRNHGKSDRGVSEWIQYGLDERKDVLAAVEYISGREEYQNAAIGLLSICMGAAATTFAYGMEEKMRQHANVKVVVAIQPLTYDHFVRVLGLPENMIARINAFNKEERGVDLTGDSFLSSAKHVTVPTLLVQNQNDPMTNMDMVKQYFEDLPEEKEMLWLDLKKKRGAAYDWLTKTPEPILRWFDAYVRP